MALQAFHVPLLLFACLEVALAAVLLSLGARQRGTRAFAYLLILRAAGGGSVVLGGLAGAPPVMDDAALLGTLRRLNPYFAIAVVSATLYFLAVYPQTPRALPKGPWLAALVLMPTLVLEGLYFVDHGLFFGTSAGTPGLGGFVANGPFSVATAASRAAYMLVALVFGLEALRAPPGPRRSSLLAVSAGFSFFPVVQVAGYLMTSATRPLAFGIVYLFVIVFAASLVVHLARRGLRDPDPRTRRTVRRYLAALALAAASTAPVLSLPAEGALRPTAFLVLSGLWLIPQPLLCAYALLRHQLFDIDVKVKWTVKQSTVAAAFIGVFFIVSEGAQQVFSESIGPVLGIVAAGALLFALAPLQHAAERVANAALPGARPLGELAREDRHAVYRDQVLYAWRDGVLTDDERGMLEHLRTRLGLSVEEAGRIEHAVARERLDARSAASF